MLPINLDIRRLNVALVGEGPRAARREALLREAGAAPMRVAADADLSGYRIVYVADLPVDAARHVAERAHAAGALVNVEDEAELCDFHTPSVVRRGDLTLSVATGGRCPGLAGALGEYLGALFDGAWAMRLGVLEAKRKRWRAERMGHAQIRAAIARTLVQSGWVPDLPAKAAASDFSQAENSETLRKASLAGGQASQ